jgi:hypothetical protein
MRLAAASIACILLAGCGGGEQQRRATAASTTATATTATAPSDADVRQALRLPDRVPLRATGEATAADVDVVRSWFEDLSAGEVPRAASRFGLPARFQNFDLVVVMKTPAEALLVTDSLPCGAKMTKAGGADGFVVYEARLVDRPGGGCGDGVGGVVRGAILVRDGHMTEWYRLPDRSRPRSGEAVIPDGPIV